MTLREFIKKLENTPRNWHLVAGKHGIFKGRYCIRINTSVFMGDCPIEAVAETPGHLFASLQLGLSRKLTKRIVHAADDNFDEFPSRLLRKVLLKATGLS